eukprot:4883604-Pyramimonas_sp.AAC.1
MTAVRATTGATRETATRAYCTCTDCTVPVYCMLYTAGEGAPPDVGEPQQGPGAGGGGAAGSAGAVGAGPHARAGRPHPPAGGGAPGVRQGRRPGGDAARGGGAAQCAGGGAGGAADGGGGRPPQAAQHDPGAARQRA